MCAKSAIDAIKGDDQDIPTWRTFTAAAQVKSLAWPLKSGLQTLQLIRPLFLFVSNLRFRISSVSAAPTPDDCVG